MSKKLLGIVGAAGAMGKAVKESADGVFDVVEITKESPVSKLPSPPDVFIDFSVPSATIEAIHYATDIGIPYVCGTTGLSPEQFDIIRDKSSVIPILYASNFSLGVAALKRAVTLVASMLPNWDAEIFEIHHRRKVDSPSGTAITLGKAIAEARQLDFNRVARLSREGQVGPRPQDEIGFQAMRGGGVAGEHTVVFASDNERIELIHRASNRKIFADGAVQAAQWLMTQKPGYYSIDDMFNTSLS